MSAQPTDHLDEPPIEHPSRRAQTERLLDSHHIAWTFYPAYPIADLRARPTSQVRMLAPDAALVEQYTSGYRQKNIFPPLVVRTGNWIVDGNTRFAAAIAAGIERVPVYLVEAGDSVVIHGIGAALNQTNGVRLTEEEQRLLAATLAAALMPNKDIAKLLSRTRSTIDNWERERVFENRCKRVGMEPPKITKDAASHLINVENDAAFKALASLVEDAGLSRSAYGPIIKEVRECGSEAGQVQLIEEYRVRLSDEIQLKSMGLANTRNSEKVVLPPSMVAWRNVKYLTKHTAEELAAIPDGRNIKLMAAGWRELAELADEVATMVGA